MAARVGLRQARTTALAERRGRGGGGAPSRVASCSAMSPPAEKARSPDPVITIAPVASSSSRSWRACANSSTSWELKALSLAGRFKVTRPTPPRRSRRTTRSGLTGLPPSCSTVPSKGRIAGSDDDSDDAGLPEGGDLGGAVAQLVEDL